MRHFLLQIGLLVLLATTSSTVAMGYCTVSLSSGCTNAWFTDISASGSGVTSSISVSGVSSCTGGGYHDVFSSQGVTAATGSTVTLSISKYVRFTSELRVYVDWDNDGNFAASELVGTAITGFTSSASYPFTIPMRGLVTNTNLRMRVVHIETMYTYSFPCSGRYGDVYDFFLRATCTTPSISVTPSSASVCGSAPVAMSVAGASSGAIYEWSPGATLSSTTGSSVTARPTAATTYSVAVYGAGICETTATVPVSYSPPPSTAPSVSASRATTLCPGTSITFTETTGIYSTYQWYMGSSPIAGATNSAYTTTPTSSVSYYVLATTTAGCTGTSSALPITVSAVPSASITAVGSTTVCDPATVRLNGAPTGAGHTYQWYNGSTAISGATTSSYTVSGIGSGSYSVQVTNSSGCIDRSAGTTVTVNPSPTASFTTSTSSRTLCQGDVLSVATTAASGSSYQWFNASALIPGATAATYTFSAPGTYNVRLQETNSFGCTDLTSLGAVVLTIVASPVSTISASGPITFCTGGSVTLSVPTGNFYQWYAGSTTSSLIAISGATNSTYTTGVTNYYAVRATDAIGCTSNSLGMPTLVTAVTTPYIYTTTSTRICAGSSLPMYVSISGSASGVVYQWKRNTLNISGATSYMYAASTSGDYSVFVNISGSCVSTTAPITLNTLPQPNPIVSYSDGKVRTQNYYATYQWYRDNVLIPGATNFEYSVRQNGAYKVRVADSNTCVSMSTPLPTWGVSVQQVQDEFSASVYPNPTSDMLQISAPMPLDAIVTTPDGKMVLVAKQQTSIDMSRLPNGLYLVTLMNKDGMRVHTEKIIKN
jgi:hypothetical protein